MDLCLKVRNAGYQIIYVGEKHLFHFESKSRGKALKGISLKRFQEESQFMKKKWGSHLNNDNYYNSNLTREREDFSLRIFTEQWNTMHKN